MGNRYTDVERITESERARLLGLLTLGTDYVRRLDDVEREMVKITGEREVGGHSSDELYGRDRPDVDDLLDRLGIEVVPDPPPEEDLPDGSALYVVVTSDGLVHSDELHTRDAALEHLRYVAEVNGFDPADLRIEPVGGPRSEQEPLLYIARRQTQGRRQGLEAIRRVRRSGRYETHDESIWINPDGETIQLFGLVPLYEDPTSSGEREREGEGWRLCP